MDLNLTFTAAVPADVACLSVDPDSRIGRGLAVPFGVPSLPSSSDGKRYRFSTPPTNADELIDVVREHNADALVGTLSEPWETGELGLSGAARFFATTAGNDALTEAKEGARRGFSVSAAITKFTTAADGVRDVIEWSARHLGVVRRPAFTAAGIQFSTHAQTPDKENTVTITAPDVNLAALATQIVKLPEIADLAEKIQNMPSVAELAEQVAGHLKTDQVPAHPLAAFSTAAAFYKEFQAADDANDKAKLDTLQAAFAVPDQVTGDNPGVMPPVWRTDIKKRIDRRTPAMTAFGTIGLPDTGMSVDWPYLDPELNIDTIVKQQLQEKDELQGAKIKILKASESIKTAGAVSDISYQLLMRSAPSYLAAHNEILEAALLRYWEAKFEAQLLAKGTAAGVTAATTAAALRKQLFELSAKVEDATGSPADTVLVATDLWTTYGGLTDLHNPKYGTQNAAGTSDASTLKIDVNGLDIKRAPFFPAGTMLVGASDAAKASNSGARISTAEDVRRLGRDVAVWGMYSDGEVYLPGGLQIASQPGV